MALVRGSASIPAISLLLFLLIPQQVVANPRVTELCERFIAGDVDTKLQILLDSEATPPGDLIPLYRCAVDFIASGGAYLAGQSNGASLSDKTLEFIASMKESGREIAAYTQLWAIFQTHYDNKIRLRAIELLGELEEGRDETRDRIVGWIVGENERLQLGADVDSRLVTGVVRTLGSLGGEAAFPTLFEVSVLGYPIETRMEAHRAMQLQGESYWQLIEALLAEKPLDERALGIGAVLRYSEGSPEARAELGISALELATRTTVQDPAERDELDNYIGSIIGYILELQPELLQEFVVERMVLPLIQYFDRVLSSWERGEGDLGSVIQAIDMLGGTGSLEAEERLTLYIGVVNMNVGRGKKPNDRIVLSVVENLGRLGGGVAVEHLLSMELLDYPQEIKQAARNVVYRDNRNQLLK